MRISPKANFLVLLVLASSTLFVSGVTAQTARFESATAQLRAATGAFARTAAGNLRNPAASRYDVVVLRVEFQPDTTRFTTGDGTFAGELYEGLQPSIDPLPHDAGYVEAHLTFLRDYVGRVSDGGTLLRTHLLPEIVRVGGPMGAYSPTGPESGSDAELAKLARLIGEAWSLADPAWAASLPALDPATTAFLIVHAGVGRDLELVGTILDKTPEDLPSLFFAEEVLDRLDPGSRVVFGGVPVTHGLLVPRTETRRGFNSLADEAFLAEFSVNGLLAASFFNYLGVPDLFDTETGASAIGPFGLMDGLGIFAYSGLFPPEPTAWTKYYLGWADPVEPEHEVVTTLEHVGDPGSSDQARASISGSEYFLVENRHRDPEGDGVVMQVWNQGAVSEVRFENGAEGFNSATVSAFPGGVVVGVDQYDFALPGGKDEDGIDLIGGTLIWHVDERVIAAGLAQNRVNADPDRRGLDLEEADSAQDLGHPSGGFFGPSFDLGSPFDFYYEGNPVVTVTASGREVRLYQNRFGPDTYPSSHASDGGAGFLELRDFSLAGPSMTFQLLRLAESGVSIASSRDLGEAAGTFSGGGLVRFVGSNGVLAFSAEEGVLQLLADEFVLARLEGLGPAEPAIAGNQLWATTPEGFLVITGSGGSFSGGAFPPGAVREITTPVVTVSGPRGVIPLIGARGDQGDVVVAGGGGPAAVTPQPSRVLGLAQVDGSSVITVLADRASFPDRQVSWTYPEVGIAATIRPAFGRDRNGVVGAVPDPANARIHMLLPDGGVSTVAVDADGALSGHVTLADLDNDGLLDALVSDASRLWGFTRTGAVTNGFPIKTAGTVVGQALAVETSEDPDIYTVFAANSRGQVEAFRPGERRVAGFPLSLGVDASMAPAIRPGKIMGLSGDGSIMEWSVDLVADLRGSDVLGEESNSNFVDTEPLTTTLLDTPKLLVPGETYNWPNPVREGLTHFRVLPTEDSSVSVLIVDMAGNEVDNLSLELAPAEVPSELVWRTDVESGVYFARVRARSVSGRTEDQLVKVAVIR